MAFIPRLHGPVLTYATTAQLADCIRRGQYNAQKVVTGWGPQGPWTDAARRQVVTTTVVGSYPPKTIVRTVVGDGQYGRGYADNPPNAVNVRAGVLSRTQTWPNLGVPYVLTDRALDIEGANNLVLTLVAGTEVRMSHDSEINIGANASDGLVAQGTAEAPVIFTAHSNAPTSGYWAGSAWW